MHNFQTKPVKNQLKNTCVDREICTDESLCDIWWFYGRVWLKDKNMDGNIYKCG